MSILDEARQLRAAGEHAYDHVITDLSLMALLSANHQAASQIWLDAVFLDSSAVPFSARCSAVCS